MGKTKARLARGASIDLIGHGGGGGWPVEPGLEECVEKFRVRQVRPKVKKRRVDEEALVEEVAHHAARSQE